MKYILLYLSLLLVGLLRAQDVIVVDLSDKNLNHSIADQFTIYESEKYLSPKEFLAAKNSGSLKKTELTQSVANLDFTTSYHYIHFVIENKSRVNRSLYLETGRPITNIAHLYWKSENGEFPDELSDISGDAIPFSNKVVQSNRTIFPVTAYANAASEYILVLGSDGEIISLPMVFYDHETYSITENRTQFFSGIFYGIFIFVILIYFTFFLLLRDRLYLIYTVYVFFSGLLQFSLDGYAHQYLFPSGGYMTQHIVIIIAGLTVFFAYLYATSYLRLAGRLKTVARILAGFVLLTTAISLIRGTLYELCYPLINGFSLLSVTFLLIIGIRIRRNDKQVSPLFLFGLFMLMTGAIIFILGNFSVIDIPSVTQNSLKIGTLVEIICLSILMAGNYKRLQDEKDEVQKRLFTELEDKNRITQEANIRLEAEVTARTQEIQKQREQIELKNRDLLDSIKYAQRIQEALLPSSKRFKQWIPESFVFFKPKDIVSGDFYWMEETLTTDEKPQRLLLIATADCTGHGVPGAFVSVVCNNLLKLSKIQQDVNTTGQALDFMDREINSVLNSEFNDQQIRDGMDVALCALNLETKMLYFSGAKNSLYLVRDGDLQIFKGERRSIGYEEGDEDFNYSTHSIQLQSGDMLYTFSDGIVDQFGGKDNKKFLAKRLKKLLIEVHQMPVATQKERINAVIEDWMNGYDQVDDMLLIGLRID